MSRDDDERTVSIDRRFAPKPSTDNPTEPSLVFLTGTLAGVTHWLSADKKIIVGRAEEADVCIQDRRVSRQHACIEVTADGAIYIEDMGSTNGTYVNGDKVTRRALKEGDQVHIGPHYMLKFSYQANLASEKSHQGQIDPARDALTGLRPKQFLVTRIDETLSSAKKERPDLTLLMFDIDGFKDINKTHGEGAGDRVLQEIVKIISPALRRDDIFVRNENDCFIILPNNSDESAAVVLAQRVRRAVKYHEFSHKDTRIPVTVSIGIGVLTKKMKNALDLMRDVEDQLERARDKGRDNINGSQSIRSVLRHLERQPCGLIKKSLST